MIYHDECCNNGSINKVLWNADEQTLPGCVWENIVKELTLDIIL